MARQRSELAVLFASPPPAQGYTASDGETITVPIEDIRANPYQPRREFGQAKIETLARGIKERGMLQAPVVRPRGSNPDGSYKYFELILGERRFRACKYLGLEEIKVDVRDVDDGVAFEMAFEENAEREDLVPYEVCLALVRLKHLREYTDAEVAQAWNMTMGQVQLRLAVGRFIQAGADWERRCAQARERESIEPSPTAIEATSWELLETVRRRPDSLSAVRKVASVVPAEAQKRFLGRIRSGVAESEIDRLLALQYPSKQQQKRNTASATIETIRAQPVAPSQGQGIKSGGGITSTPAPTDAKPFQIPSQSRNSTEAAEAEEEAASTSGHSYAEAQNAAARASTPAEAEKLRGITEAQARDRYERAQGIDTTPTQPRAATVAALAAVDAVRAGALDAEAQMAELGRIWREWAA